MFYLTYSQDEHFKKKRQREADDAECTISDDDDSDASGESIDLSVIHLQDISALTKVTDGKRISVSVIRLLLFKHLLKQENNLNYFLQKKIGSNSGIYLVKRKGEKKSRGLLTSRILETELSVSLKKSNTLEVCCAFGYPKITDELVNYHMIDSDRE